MATMPELKVDVVFIEESKLREIIREEIQRALPRYTPPPVPEIPQWWQAPTTADVIPAASTGESSAPEDPNQYTINAEREANPLAAQNIGWK